MYLVYGLFILTILLSIIINRGTIKKMNKINTLSSDRLRNRYRRKRQR